MTAITLIILWIFVFYVGRAIRSRSASKRGSAGLGPDRSAKPVFSDDRSLVLHDLRGLNAVRPRLAQEVVRYIFEGDSDSVLLILQQNSVKAEQALRTGSWGWRAGRHDFLLGAETWRPDVVRRYAEVLAILYPVSPWEWAPGSGKAPMWFRRLMQVYGRARRFHGEQGNGAVLPPSRTAKPWTLDQLKSLVPDDPWLIVDAAFEERHLTYAHDSQSLPQQMPGLQAFLEEDPQRRLEEIGRLSAKARANGLRYLAAAGLTSGDWLEFALQQSGDSAKTVREGAVALLREASMEELTPRVRADWPNLRVAQKTSLVSILAQSPQGAETLRDLSQGESNPTVLAEINRQLVQGAVVQSGEGQASHPDGEDGYTDIEGNWIASPAPAPLPDDVPVSSALAAPITQAFNAWRAAVEAQNAERASRPHYYPQEVPPTNAADRFIATMDGRGQAATRGYQYSGILADWGLGPARQALKDRILAHPDLTLWHLVRSLGQGHSHYDPATQGVFHLTSVGEAIRTRLSPPGDLRTYGRLLEVLHRPANALVGPLLADRYSRPSLEDWPDVAIWPFLLGHLDALDVALGLRPDKDNVRREVAAMRLLERFPSTPARYVRPLLDMALGDSKSLREPARRLLARTPGLTSLLYPLLQHPRGEVRGSAARWLGDLGDQGAVAPLLAAARKETTPAVKASLLAVAAHLGGDISEHLSPKALLAEAKAGLKKANLKAVSWVPFDTLPRIRMRDGAAVDPDAVKWWVVLAVKLKQPGGNAWSELLLDQIEPVDAERLGLALLQAFIVQDTLAPGDDEANAYADTHIDGRMASYKRWNMSLTRDQVYAELRREKMSQYFGSANDQKGLLALATRTPGADAVAATRSFFRDHYQRVAQCKALIECLAANPSPLATQFVLSISKRWRTRGVKELAMQLVEQIADRNGWTPDELADRTVPTGGFDERGVLELPIGEKTYEARLDSEGRIGLFNADGKVVQSLPSSISGPAVEDLAEAKRALSAGRKEVKQVWDMQSRRLHEALCIQREWSAPDWAEYILGHPVMTRMAQRLVWEGRDAAGDWIAFRPLEDLSLTDAADAPVAIASFTAIRLAHGSLMQPDQIAAWKTHLSDYDVKPLFSQIDRPMHRAATGQNEVTDREGWGIETFKLRGAAAKLGYSRGSAEDGGWFMTYEKPYDSLKLTVVIEFTGAPLPEANEPAALIAMRIVRQRSGRHTDWSRGEPLLEVPPVLVSEAWSDLHAMAAAGTGFDETWKKQFNR